MAGSIVVAREGRRAVVRIDRPPANVLDIAAMQELCGALDEVKAHEAELNVLVVGAEGEKAFCAGVDVADHTADKVVKMIETFHGIFRRLEGLDVVTVAAVKGLALGGGCELAMACDLVVAADTARFGQPEIKLAVFPPLAMVYLAPIVGTKRAMEMILMGEVVQAPEARAMGLVNQVFPAAELDKGLDVYVGKLEALSGSALRAAKGAFKRTNDAEGFEKRLWVAEDAYLNGLMALEDAAEGLGAFLEKRKPVWKNR